jgi:hypothetical protein
MKNHVIHSPEKINTMSENMLGSALFAVSGCTIAIHISILKDMINATKRLPSPNTKNVGARYEKALHHLPFSIFLLASKAGPADNFWAQTKTIPSEPANKK